MKLLGLAWVSIKDSLFLLGLLWAVFVFDRMFNLGLTWYGVHPRSTGDLWMVMTAPILHADLPHLVGNSAAILPMCLVGAAWSRPRFWVAVLFIWLSSGLAVWLIGSGGSNHIGISGVVYGLTSYLFFTGIFQRDLKSLLVSALVFFLFSGHMWALFDFRREVSWEFHVSGFVAGIAWARLSRKRSEVKPDESGLADSTLADTNNL